MGSQACNSGGAPDEEVLANLGRAFRNVSIGVLFSLVCLSCLASC
jgi:hypothetical protein